MGSIANRLLLPLVVSVSGILLTHMWYIQATKSKMKMSTGQPIAFLKQRSDLVERRPTTRLIWQAIDQGEPLFAGESVRTTSRASGQIHFLSSGMTVGLEPDSLIVIEESKGKIALNLVNGGVFVKNEDSPSQQARTTGNLQPVIKAGAKTIALDDKKVELNVSLSESGQASLAVSKGKVAVSGNGSKDVVSEGGAATLANSSSAPQVISVKSPRPNSVIPMSPQMTSMRVEWKALSLDGVLSIEMGSSRDQLTPKMKMHSSASSAVVPAFAGGFFWRLVLRSSGGKVLAESPIIYNEGLVLEAPQLLVNASGESVFFADINQNQKNTLKLAWSRPQGVDLITVLIAKDSNLNEVVERKQFSTETDWDLELKKAGTYYWQARASWPGISSELSSKLGQFKLDLQKEIPVPSPESPRNQEKLSKAVTDENGVVLVWSKVSGADSYLLNTSNQRSDGTWEEWKTTESPAPQYRLTRLASGTWRWQVQAKLDTDASKKSEIFEFKILDVGLLDMSKIAGLTHKFSQKNLVSLQVGRTPKESARLRFRVAKKGIDLKDLPWNPAPLTGVMTISFETPGEYQLAVEALDGRDRVLAGGQAESFQVSLPDLLRSPTLAKNAVEVQADPDGNAEVVLTEIKEAASYLLELKGSKPQNYKSARNARIKVPGLLPGKHSFVVMAVDAYGRAGEVSREYSINVPATSSITGPKAKSVRVGD